MKNICIAAKAGADISAIYCNPEESSAKGVVVVCHGFGEHSGMYLETAGHLGKAGYASIIFDQRGHGASAAGKKNRFGVIPGYQSFLDDVASVTEEAQRIDPNLPIALYGHSMGGNIVANALMRNSSGRYSCAVLEAPWLGLYKRYSPLIIGIGRLAGRISPNLAIINKLAPAALTSDPERMESYTNDQLYHGRISFRMFTGINDSCDYALENAASITVPVFIAYAAEDRVLNNDKTLGFVAAAGDMATAKEYCSRHAIHNDVERDAYFSDMIAFLDSHML